MSLRIYGNRLLQTPAGLRPTSGRVRQAVFNILQGQILGCRWLDLCAGAGTMGAEALCRGASEVVGIERSALACRVIRANWTRIAQPGQTQRVIEADVCRILAQPSAWQRFDLIYFDPPYEAGLYAPVLTLLPAWLAPTGLIIAEHRSSNTLPERIDASLVQTDQRRYGETGLAFYALNSD